MPIKPIVLQRRHAELGRIRLGHKHGGNGFPVKGTSFRFTSPMERYVRDLAALYGGEPRPWDNDGKAEFEVFTDATSIPVIVIKGGLSQWMEHYQGKTCVHRCDGEVNVLTNTPCHPDDPSHKAAKPTTHLSVMLPELEAIGAWHMVSRGWNAAAEIPAVAELAQFVGDLVPAHLNMVERRSMKEGKTTRFVVPVLDLQIGTARLREIVAEKSGASLQLVGPSEPEHPALQAPAQHPPAADPYLPYFEAVAAAVSLDALTSIWADMVAARLVGEHAAPSPRATEFVAAFKARAQAVKPPAEETQRPGVGDPVDAEVVEHTAVAPSGEPDPDAVWQQILAAGSEKRGWGLDEVVADFKSTMGLIPDEASGSELAAYLHMVVTGEEPAA